MTQEQPKMGEKDKISECAETIRGIKDYESIIAVSAFKHKTTQEIQNALTYAIRVLERVDKEKIKQVITTSKYREIFQDRMINAGFPGDTSTLAEVIAQAIITALTAEKEG